MSQMTLRSEDLMPKRWYSVGKFIGMEWYDLIRVSEIK